MSGGASPDSLGGASFPSSPFTRGAAVGRPIFLSFFGVVMFSFVGWCCFLVPQVGWCCSHHLLLWSSADSLLLLLGAAFLHLLWVVLSSSLSLVGGAAFLRVVLLSSASLGWCCRSLFVLNGFFKKN